MVGVHRAPADVRAVPPKGERVLAWGRDRRGDAVVVTLAALYLPRPSGEHLRVPFDQVSSASWTDPNLDVALVGPEAATYRVWLEQPGEVPPAVRERVTASIVLSERVLLDGDLGARITARRTPGRDGVTWNVVFDSGLDPADPELRARADAAIADLRSSRGV